MRVKALNTFLFIYNSFGCFYFKFLRWYFYFICSVDASAWWTRVSKNAMYLLLVVLFLVPVCMVTLPFYSFHSETLKLVKWLVNTVITQFLFCSIFGCLQHLFNVFMVCSYNIFMFVCFFVCLSFLQQVLCFYFTLL